MTMKLVVAGQGAFGIKHIEALKNIPDVEIVSLAGGSIDSTRDVAQKYGIPHFSTNLDECLAQPGVVAAILATPTQMHAKQGVQCMRAGKHVHIEIPIADNLKDAEELVKVQKETGLIAMDMSIGMKTPGGALCTLSLSFNNDGPLGTFFRYICDNGTYIARYDDLFDGKNNQIDVSKVDVSMNGIELQDREFIAAIKEKREPNASVQQLLPVMQTLDKLEKCF